MPRVDIECLWECDDGLGETPIWREGERALYWADHVGPRLEPNATRRPTIRRLDPVTGDRKSWTMPEQIGSFGFREGGGIVGAAQSGFCFIDLEGGRFERLADPEPRLPDNRLNDGKIDRRGRFWAGSMNTRLGDKTSRLHRFDPDGSVHAVAPEFAFVVANGIAFSPDDTTMYFGDSIGGTIYAFDFDFDEGRISNPREFSRIPDPAPAIVDGATVDAEGYYWFALNLAGKIVRLDPKGRVDREVEMPVRSPTCVTFGGDHYETMYVTSQQAFMTPEEMARHPQPGAVFAVHGLGVRGLPEPTFGG